MLFDDLECRFQIFWLQIVLNDIQTFKLDLGEAFVFHHVNILRLMFIGIKEKFEAVDI